MSLQFVLGCSGSGKSRFLYETIIRESMERPKEMFLVIVPEQFTMETQKKLVELHPRKGILNIDVLSFQRLALRVLEDTGADKRKVLEETGKNLVIRRVAMEHEKELTLLSGSIQKTGYIKQVKSMISELAQYNIEPEDMEGILSALEGNPRLYHKFKDLEVLYKAFRERMEKEYVTAEEVLEVLAENAGKSELLKDCTIALDGFTGFTPIQQKLLKELLVLAKKVYVTVTVDPKEDWGRLGPVHELFYLSKKTIHSITGLCREMGVEIEEPVIQKKAVRFLGQPALAYLERNLFRSGRKGWREAAYKEEPQEISIHLAANPREEIRFAAGKILELTRSGQCSYGEIALISGDMETYAREVRRVFPKYDIPYFIDETRKVLLNPFLEYLKSALEVLIQDYSYESIFRFLRTGLVGEGKEEAVFTQENIDFVENYVLASGIRGYSGWKKAWERPVRTIPEEQLGRLNTFREAFLQKMESFTEGMKQKGITVRERSGYLYRFMAEEKIQKKLAKMEQEFEARQEAELAKEYHQIYDIVLSLLDKMVEFLGDEVLSLTDYKEILEAGLDDSKVGLIPPTPDEVLIGDMQRTRLKEIKVLIFLGLNEGVVPSGEKGGGILSEQERGILEKQGMVLAPGAKENSFVERFYLYLHLTKPSKRLYLMLAKSDMDGKAMRPSYVLARMQSLFPALKIQDEDGTRSLKEQIWTPQNGLEYLTEGLRKWKDGEALPEFQELYRWYYSNENYQSTVEWLLTAAFGSRQTEGIGKEAAHALYGSILTNSVTRLETFAACAYAHFLQYGLRLSERETLEFAPVDMGNLFHKALEVFSRKLEGSQYTWFDIPDEEAERLTEAAIQETVAHYDIPGLRKDSRSAYAIQRIRRIMKRTIWALLLQIRSGIFKPGNFEVAFSTVEDLESVNIALSEEEKMKLRGRIDRIDTCEKENEVYVKVVDYKSGNTRFDLAALYYGLQLQLVVYLNAAMELEKKIHPDKEIIPAGIFYYKVDDPLLDMEADASPEKIQEMLLRELKVNGIVNEREDVVRAMDQNISGTSRVIPVAVNKDGSYSKTSKVYNTAQFRRISAYVNQKLKELGKEILDGNTTINPYERKEQTACDYCAFQGVCGFDPKLPDMKYRRLKELSPEEIFRDMGEVKE